MNDDHAICNPAGSCCTPKVSDDAIREAVVEALQKHLAREVGECCARVALDAVRPLIEADLRGRLLAKVVQAANFESGSEQDIGYYDGLMHAARLIETP